jgi:hypothetical protein
MKVYIAGPMRGLPEQNFPAFREAAAEWRCAGHEVISPAEIDEEQDGFDGTDLSKEPSFTVAMRRDIAAILTCDAVALLPGWLASEGARVEYRVAKAIGLQIFYARTHEPVDVSWVWATYSI